MKYKIKKFFRYLKYHSYVKRWIIVGIWCFGFLILIGGAMFGNRISNIANTPLNQAVNFQGNDTSSSGNSAMKLVSKAYSPDKKRMILQLKSMGNNDVTQQILAKYLKFNVKSIANTDAEVSIIPVTDNDYLIDINNLKPHFQALQVAVTNDTPVTGSSAKSQGTAKFTINEDKQLQKQNVSDLSDTKLAQKVAKKQIEQVKKDIEQNKNKIKIAKKTINADLDRKKALEENEKYEVASQKKKTDDNLQSLKGDIEQNKQIIEENKHGIEIGKKKIKLLEKKQKAIEDGQFKMPPKQQITKIEQAHH